MRLRHTRTGICQWIDKPTDFSYAIVSYLFEAPRDDSSRDVANREMNASIAVRSSVGSSSAKEFDALSPMAQNACRLASVSGYDYVLLERCCSFDASDAKRLHAPSEMWEWYACAGTCYAYLADVPAEDIPSQPNSSFRRSNWHEDVWTLQTLVAPWNVVFLARDWSVLGTKSELAAVVEEVTGVDTAVLKGERCARDVSVARRMWWASKRRAALVEDRAYSLLGLFGVKMSIAYGEGLLAFMRLQEEVFRVTSDQSIFAWHYHPEHDHPDCLLALGPCCFSRSGNMRPIPYDDLATRLSLPADATALFATELTSQGLNIRLPLIPHQISSFPPTSALYEVFGVAARFSHVAMLQCEDEQGKVVVLTLNSTLDSSSSDEYLVRAVETTLGQCDRTWSYSPVLYREAIEVRDIVIRRGALHSPWIVPSLTGPAGSASGPSETRVQIALTEGSRSRLAERHCVVHSETARRELIDDLYPRARRAKRFVDVHRFVLSNSAVPEEDTVKVEYITVELSSRRNCPVPISVDRIRVRYAINGPRREDTPLPLEAILTHASGHEDDPSMFKARYALQPAPDSSQVLSVSLSRRADSIYVYLLELDLAPPSERTDILPQLSNKLDSWGQGVDEGRPASPSRASGRVMEVFPRLPSIRGWASRRRAHAT